jgi:hypothetical protein
VKRALDDCDAQARADDEAVAEAARIAARRSIESHTGRRPMVLVSVNRT